jgi:hypothetical protein
MNLRAMNMLYESIVKRGSLMVVPSGLADSLNVPSLMGALGANKLLPENGAAEAGVPAASGPVNVTETTPDVSGRARKEH